MSVRSRTRGVRALWAPSRVRRIARHRYVQLAAGLIVVGVVVGISAAGVRGADEQRRRWGETREVAVVTRSVEVGEPIAGSYEPRVLPLMMIPPGAVDSVASDALAKATLYPGEVLLRDRVTTHVERGWPPGTVGITLQLQGGAPLVRVGDLVDVWAVDPAGPAAERVATAVQVVARSDDDVTVAIGESLVAEVAVVSWRPVTLTVLG